MPRGGATGLLAPSFSATGAYSLAKIVITIQDGVAVATDDIPTDVSVEVRTYDVANISDELLSKDKSGRQFHARVWRAPE